MLGDLSLSGLFLSVVATTLWRRAGWLSSVSANSLIYVVGHCSTTRKTVELVEI